MCEAVLQAFDFVALKHTSMKRGHKTHSWCVGVYASVGVHECMCVLYHANEYRANSAEVIM